MQKFEVIEIDGQSIPVKVIAEHRKNSRASLGADHVILRIPIMEYRITGIDAKIQWLSEWLVQLNKTKPHVLTRYKKSVGYTNGQSISIYHHTFTLVIHREELSVAKIRMAGDRLEIGLPSQGAYDEQRLIKKLLIKIFQRYFEPIIHERVKKINEAYFQEKFSSVKLKYNKTNWGSCSSGRNLNFSLRLLLAPEDVIDYVIIHELAHLIEMNHSDRFWRIVEGIMPDYKQKEKFLKEHSSTLDF